MVHLIIKKSEYCLEYDSEEENADKEVILHADVIRYGLRMNRMPEINLIQAFVDSIQDNQVVKF